MKDKIICSGNSNHEKAYVSGDATNEIIPNGLIAKAEVKIKDKEKQPIFINIGKQGFDELTEFTNRVTKQTLPQRGKNATGRDNFSVTGKGVICSDRYNSQEKQIAEMASDMDYACTERDLYPSDAKEIAKVLHLLDYRKVKKDSVVLSKEEYGSKLQDAYDNGLKWGTKWGSKEMAKNIITKIKQFLSSIETIRGDDINKLQPEIGYSMREVDDLLDKLAEQFDVEIKD